MNIVLIVKKTIKSRDRNFLSLADKRKFKSNYYLRDFICSELYCMRDCEYFNKVQVDAIKQVVKIQDTKIVNV